MDLYRRESEVDVENTRVILLTISGLHLRRIRDAKNYRSLNIPSVEEVSCDCTDHEYHENDGGSTFSHRFSLIEPALVPTRTVHLSVLIPSITRNYSMG